MRKRLITEYALRDTAGAVHWVAIYAAEIGGYCVYIDDRFYTNSDSYRLAEDAADDYTACEGWEA